MLYQIREISTIVGGGRVGALYTIADYWLSRADFDPGNPPYYSEDFVAQYRTQGRRVVTDAQGRLRRRDGVFVAIDDITEPDKAIGWDRETVARDVVAELREDIERHWFRVVVPNGLSGDQTRKKLWVRGRADPQGLLAVVSGLVGSVREVQ